MGRNLLARGSIDTTTEYGTIDGEDFYKRLTVRTSDEEHGGDLLVEGLFMALLVFITWGAEAEVEAEVEG